MSDQILPKLPKKTPEEIKAMVKRMREVTPEGFRMPPPSDPAKHPLILAKLAAKK